MATLHVRPVVVLSLAFLTGMAVAVAAHAQSGFSLLGVSTDSAITMRAPAQPAPAAPATPYYPPAPPKAPAGNFSGAPVPVPAESVPAPAAPSTRPHPRINLEGTGTASAPPPPPPPPQAAPKPLTWKDRIMNLISHFMEWLPEALADAKKWWGRIMGGGAA